MKKKLKAQQKVLFWAVVLSGLVTCLASVNAEDQKSPDIQKLKASALNGNAEAQAQLGKSFCNENSSYHDYEQAENWFRKSAEQGNAQGEFGLGTLYFFGRGVRQDYSKAIEWISKAAEQDDAVAQCTLGRIHYDGIGTPKNLVEAYKWFDLSARHNSPLAIRCREITASHLKADELANAQKIAANYVFKSKAREVKVVLNNSTSL